MSSERSNDETRVPPPTVFDAVANYDFEGILTEYVKEARNTIVSYLSLRERWSSKSTPSEQKQEEKLDEYLQHLADESATWPKGGADSSGNVLSCYHEALAEISSFLSRETLECDLDTPRRDIVESSEEANRLIWQSINIVSNSRPPSSFVVNHRNGTNQQVEGQPLFDGGVANATPPPLGPPGIRPSAGSGTLLHLACTMDSPFALSIFLALGADPRSPHTAFRRLMIHEAACSGSVKCLTLLLELGKECALQLYKEDNLNLPTNHEEHVFVNDHSASLPLIPTPNQLKTSSKLPLRMRQARPSFGLPKKPKVPETKSWLEKIKHFFSLAKRVRLGIISDLDAARTVLAYDTISNASRQIIAQSCSFLIKDCRMPGNPFNCPWYADGHGNTPLHWAAFKNERDCVAILLKYHADPNARAHPSGWTALHDAAYSNSAESVALLLSAGATVDIRANSGATPLCFAAQEDADGAAKLLLEQGADISLRCAGGPRSNTTTGTNAIAHANGRFSGYTPLHYCAHYNANRAARILLAHPSAKFGMEIPDLSDRLPIHVAVARGSSDVLRELLHAGARIEIPSGIALSPRRARSLSSGSDMSVTLNNAEEMPTTPTQSITEGGSFEDGTSTPVSSPILRSMIPSRPITSSKPWNCLTQRSIDECRNLISQAEQNWAPDRHLLFTPADRRAVFELLRVGKRLEQMGTGIFIDLWPLVLSFCGRGWFELVQSDEVMGDVFEQSNSTDMQERNTI
mmetsp:Transcript_30261/g.44724  ORF Transcript_30261/g.44724 Transcript_30261/m.44724 type:complete len:746 (+) Transcript_30261:28-2265(+)